MQDDLQKEGYKIERTDDAIEIYDPSGKFKGAIFKKNSICDKLQNIFASVGSL